MHVKSDEKTNQINAAVRWLAASIFNRFSNDGRKISNENTFGFRFRYYVHPHIGKRGVAVQRAYLLVLYFVYLQCIVMQMRFYGQ